MASASLRHWFARSTNKTFIARASDSAAARLNLLAASLSSAAEGAPTTQALYAQCPLSTTARIMFVSTRFGAAPTTLADSALSPSSFHHSGLTTSLHSFIFSMSKAADVACAQPSESAGKRSLASRNRCAASTKCPELLSVVPRFCACVGLIWPQGDDLAKGLSCSAPVVLRGVPRALSQQAKVLVSRLRGAPGHLLCDLASLLLAHPAVLPQLPILLHLLVKHRVQLPSARVPRAVNATPVRRQQLLLAALVAHRVLLPLVVHIRRQPGAADASEAQRHVRRRAALVSSGRRDGGLGLALRLQRVYRLADLLGGRSQLWLLRPQLGEQRLEAEVGISYAQSANGLERGLRHPDPRPVADDAQDRARDT